MHTHTSTHTHTHTLHMGYTGLQSTRHSHTRTHTHARTNTHVPARTNPPSPPKIPPEGTAWIHDTYPPPDTLSVKLVAGSTSSPDSSFSFPQPSRRSNESKHSRQEDLVDPPPWPRAHAHLKYGDLCPGTVDRKSGPPTKAHYPSWLGRFPTKDSLAAAHSQPVGGPFGVCYAASQGKLSG